MEDVAFVILYLFAEVIFFTLCYYTGWIVLKGASLGRIALEPRREKWNMRKDTGESYHLSDFETSLVGFFTLFGVVLVLLAKTTGG